ncbi:MAG TPA: PDGLE domain-containing protein [Acidimicrobiales bacterium]
MSRRLHLAAFVAVGLAVAAALAFFVSPHASGEPDGLERVAHDQGFADREAGHPLGDAPTADYAVEGVDDEGLSTGLAGLLGVAVTFAVTAGLFVLVRRWGGRRGPGPGAGSPGALASPGSAAGSRGPGSSAPFGPEPPGPESPARA